MTTQPLATATTPQPSPLLDLVRQVARTRFGQDGPGERFAHWSGRPVLFFAPHRGRLRQFQYLARPDLLFLDLELPATKPAGKFSVFIPAASSMTGK